MRKRVITDRGFAFGPHRHQPHPKRVRRHLLQLSRYGTNSTSPDAGSKGTSSTRASGLATPRPRRAAARRARVTPASGARRRDDHCVVVGAQRAVHASAGREAVFAQAQARLLHAPRRTARRPIMLDRRPQRTARTPAASAASSSSRSRAMRAAKRCSSSAPPRPAAARRATRRRAFRSRSGRGQLIGSRAHALAQPRRARGGG